MLHRPARGEGGETAGGADSLSQSVYKRLREAIVTGVYHPRERLREVQLAEWLSSSRTPIREALQRLDSEGLVTSVRRGWVVREHTAAEIRAIYEVRTALEGYASRLAAERATNHELSEIENRLAEHAHAIADHDHVEHARANEAFHRQIIVAAHNDRLSEAIRSSSEHYFNHTMAQRYAPEETAASAAQHRALAEALLRRAADVAERITREHIFDALQVTLRHRR